MPGHRSPSLPFVPPAPLARKALEIERLRDLADDGGLGTLSYLLDMALIEARHQAEQRRRDADERHADPDDLWRPLS